MGNNKRRNESCKNEKCQEMKWRRCANDINGKSRA
jgi:hypothetical protein